MVKSLLFYIEKSFDTKENLEMRSISSISVNVLSAMQNWNTIFWLAISLNHGDLEFRDPHFGTYFAVVLRCEICILL